MARFGVAAVAVVLTVGPGLAGSDAWWDAAPDSAVASLGDLADAQAVTYDRTDRFAAAAFPDPKRPKRSVVRMTVRGESRGVDDIAMPAHVRGLLYVGGIDTVFVVVQRTAKKRAIETYLVSMNVDKLDASRGINLPHGSGGMEIWGREGSLVVASTDEIRTFRLPDYRSGPLYRVPGNNYAILNLSGTNRFVVGRDDGVVVVDFDDPSGREGLPIQERVATDAPVAAIAPLPDGRISILLDDGQTRTLWVDPLRTTPDAPEKAPPPPPAPPVEEVVEVVETEPVAVEETLIAEVPVVTEAPAVTVVAAVPDEPVPDEPVAILGDVDLHGRLSGKAAEEVKWVVLQGPDNLLKEAARVEPDDRGRWSCGGLAPGTYRIVVEAGGNRVVQSNPSFRVVRVESGADPIEVEAIEVLRVR